MIRTCSLYHAQEHILLEHQAHICTCSCHCICSLVSHSSQRDHLISSLTVLLANFKHHNFVVIHFYMVAWWWYPLPYYIKSFSVSCVFIQIHLIPVHITCYECLTSCTIIIIGKVFPTSHQIPTSVYISMS